MSSCTSQKKVQEGGYLRTKISGVEGLSSSKGRGKEKVNSLRDPFTVFLILAAFDRGPFFSLILAAFDKGQFFSLITLYLH